MDLLDEARTAYEGAIQCAHPGSSGQAALCLGGNTFGWTTDQTASEAVLNAYAETGGNFIDTADVYARWVPGNTGGESETAMGRIAST